MPALFIFLLKVNLALIAFCLGYYLVLRKLTFYTLNRFYLVLGIIFSSVYPFINIDSFMQRHQQLAQIQQAVVNLKAPAEKLLTDQWYWNLAAMIFWIGAAVFALRLMVQFISLYKIYKRSESGTLEQYEVRITDADISPFSFWNSIFINPDNIEAADLKNILQHEHVHVSEWHTLDILLAEISVVFYWFNPGIWLMKKAVSENIEFITDREILQRGIDSKAYQYSLLNVSLGTDAAPRIASHFNFSTLKKRIRMMNARRSSNINLTRYAVLVPMVVICLCIFSVSKADIVSGSKVAYVRLSESIRQVVGGPLTEVTIKGKKNKPHKFFVLFTDTSKKTAIPMTFQFTNDSIARQNLTFQIRKQPGTPTVYAINGTPVTATEFGARRPRGKMETINIITDYGAGSGRHLLTGIPAPPDRPGIKSNADESGTQTAEIDGKPIESIRTVENITLTPPVKDSVEIHIGKPIHTIRLNGKNISKDELDKLPASIIGKVVISDRGNNTKNAGPADSEKNIDISAIRAVRLNGKQISKDELDKLPASMLEKVHVVDSKKSPGYNTKEENPSAFKRTWDIEMTTKKQPQ